MPRTVPKDEWVTGAPEGDDWVTGVPAPSKSSTAGAFARGAERGALPAAAGLAGFAGGAAAVQPIVAPVAAATGPAAPLVEGVGTFLGGAAGAFGGATAIQHAQQWVLDHAPTGVVKALGLDKEQQQADVEEHPIASFAGELAPNLALIRPGAVQTAVEEGAPAISKLLANPVAARAVPATIMGTQEAGSELLNEGKVDPTKVALAAGVGALSNRETALGERVARAGAAPVQAVTGAMSRIHPGPTPDEVAAPVMAAGTADDAIAAARQQVEQPPVNVEGMAAEARRQGEAAAAAQPVVEPQAEAEKPVAQADQPQPAAAQPVAEGQPEAPTLAAQPSARDFPPFADAKQKADTYSRWLGELDEQRRDAAAASPQAKLLQQTEAAILKKVNGVEDRLTDAQAQRLQDVRQRLDTLLNPEGDSPDMARVRSSMLAEQQNMADAVVAHRDLALERARQAREQAQALEEPITDEEADDIGAAMGHHQIDAHQAVADHIERKALEEVQSDHAATGDRTYAEAVPVRGGEGQADRGIGDGGEGPAPIPGSEGRAGAPGGPVAEAPGEARELAPASFVTAKGSVYDVHPDGTTTRNKAARTTPGHEGDAGLKPRTAKTLYVDSPEQAASLSAAGLQGLGPKGARVIVRDGKASLLTWNEREGKWGRSPSSKDIPVSDKPGIGKAPLELWKPADDVPGYEAYRGMHAGNAITEISALPRVEARVPEPAVNERSAPAAAPRAEAPLPAEVIPEPPVRAKALKAIEGTGEERERALNGALYKVGEERPQLEAAAKLAEEDPESAIAIAMRQKQPPAGVHPEFVYMAVEAKAIREGNIELQRRLSQSKIAEEATTMGQRIAALRNRAEISPVEDMRRIQEARAAKAKERGTDPEKAIDDLVTKAQADIKKAAKSSKRPAWNDFIVSLSCAD